MADDLGRVNLVRRVTQSWAAAHYVNADDLLAALREAQSRLACAEPARRLDACSCWQGYEAAIRIVEESL